MISTPEFATIADWSSMTGMKRSTVYKELGAGNLRAVKRGKNTLVDVRHGLAYLSALAPVKLSQAPGAPIAPDAKASIRSAASSALQKHPDNIEAARDLFIAMLSREQLLVLFSPWLKVATGDYLSAALKAKAETGDAGRVRGAEKAAGGMPASPLLSTATSPAHPPITRQNLASAAQAVASQMARNLLRSFLVNGKPIHDVTPLEARGWAASRRRDARFVELLCAGIPDSCKIGDFRTSEEAERLYDQAQEESSHA